MCKWNWSFRDYASELGLPHSTHCFNSREEGETLTQVICNFPVLARGRQCPLHRVFMEAPKNVSGNKIISPVPDLPSGNVGIPEFI